MKRFIAVAILAGALVALVGGTALAAGPVTPPWPNFGPMAGVQTDDTYPCGPMGAGGMRRGGGVEWAGGQDAIAELLDMTDEEIQAERLEGKSLAQIAATKGVSEDTLIDAIVSAKKDTLDSLVADGKLTQSQADFMIQNMTDRVETMVERTGVGPAFDQDEAPGMMGRGMRGGRWNRS